MEIQKKNVKEGGAPREHKTSSLRSNSIPVAQYEDVARESLIWRLWSPHELPSLVPIIHRELPF